jgi:hypothetical protein
MKSPASLKVGPLVWRDHRVLAMDMKEISGTLGENVEGGLGVDFLSEFEIFVVDVRHHKLILSLVRMRHFKAIVVCLKSR